LKLEVKLNEYPIAVIDYGNELNEEDEDVLVVVEETGEDGSLFVFML
jgi:hypothetical protein